jgi:hypothetical protein
MSERPDDAEVRAVEMRLAAAFPLDTHQPNADVVLTRASVGCRRATRLTRVIVAMAALVAALGVAALALAIQPRRAVVAPRPRPVASVPATESLKADTYVNYTPPLLRVPRGAQIARPLRTTRDLAVASRAVGFEVLLPQDSLGQGLDSIEIPPEDATSTGTSGAIIHYGALHYDGIYMTEFCSSSEASAAEEVQNPNALRFDARWDHWEDVNGHRTYATAKSHLEAPGGRVMPVSQVVWNDGPIVYRLQSQTLTYEQLLVIARSVPAR